MIVYSMHHGDYSSSQVAAVCGSLERAQLWLFETQRFTQWASRSRVEHEGLRMRLVTDFSETSWSTYTIEEHEFVV